MPATSICGVGCRTVNEAPNKLEFREPARRLLQFRCVSRFCEQGEILIVCLSTWLSYIQVCMSCPPALASDRIWSCDFATDRDLSCNSQHSLKLQVKSHAFTFPFWMNVLSASEEQELSSWLFTQDLTPSLRSSEQSTSRNSGSGTRLPICGHLGLAASSPTPAAAWWHRFQQRHHRRHRAGPRRIRSADTRQVAGAIQPTVPQVPILISLQFAFIRRCNLRSYEPEYVARTGLVHDS